MNKKLIFSAVLVCLLLAVVVGVAFAQNTPSVRWEYNAIPSRQGYDNPTVMVPTFNRLGTEGWELVGYENGLYVFKRRLP